MRERSKLPVLLTELTLMLLVFALCAAVCLSIFASARTIADGSAALSRASLWAQSAAECYKAAGGDVGAAAELLGLEREGRSAAGEREGLTLTVSPSGDRQALISVSDAGGETVFSLTVKAVDNG